MYGPVFPLTIWLSSCLTFNHIFSFFLWLSCSIIFNRNCFSTLQNIWQKNSLSSYMLRNSISHCVSPSVCLSIGRSVGPSFGSAFYEQFLHRHSCPITHYWYCHVYGTPLCPCPPIILPLPNCAWLRLSCIRPCFIAKYLTSYENLEFCVYWIKG